LGACDIALDTNAADRSGHCLRFFSINVADGNQELMLCEQAAHLLADTRRTPCD
jgi:hypothetical protein